MKIRLLTCILVMLVPFGSNAQSTRIDNPILPGFHPDPSICRVEDDFYLATSTFEYFPGVPIYHSKDLVHWHMIGHALHRPSQLNLDGVKCSAGIYAPALRYHNGTFFMASTLTGGAGNFIVTASDPAGPWSEPHFIDEAPGIDPSLFFNDDGRIYFCGTKGADQQVWPTHNNIWVQELDTTCWRLTGPKIEVIDGSAFYKSNTRMDGGFENGVNNFEAPHIHKKDGRYYILLAHGGTAHHHAVSIWMSDQVFGPYVPCPQNPILTHRDLSPDFPITSTGHADLVQTQTGEWWAVFLGKRPLNGSTPLGRETFLAPVDWSGLWPVINPQGEVGRAETTIPRPNLPEVTLTGFPQRDEFNGPSLHPEWTFIRTPRSDWWNFSERPGYLRVRLREEKISEQVHPSFIGIRMQHFGFTANLKLDFTPEKPEEEAGMVVERDMNYYFRFVICKSEEGVRAVLAKKAGDGIDEILSTGETLGYINYLSITVRDNFYTFRYSADGQNWTTLAEEVEGNFLGVPQAGRFTGTMLGMYASSNGKISSNHVDFDWFEYKASP